MNSLQTTIMALILFLGIISCGNDNFPEQSKLGGLRVLAISADTPEMNSSGTVVLTPLISYVDGAGVTLNYTWEACPDPGIDFGADINCDSTSSALKLSGSGTFNTSTLAASFYTGAASTISITLPAGVATYFAGLDSTLQFNGVDFICVLKYVDPNNNNTISSLKRIKISNKGGGDLNTNPSFTNILFNNSTIAAYPNSEGSFLLSGTSSPETYSKITNVGTRTFSEDMYISWYASSGEFLFNRTDLGEENTFTPSGTTGVFVAVYRDGRGGVFSRIYSF